MQYRNTYIYLLVSLGLLGTLTRCQKNVATTDVIHIHASSKTVLADGSSLDTIYADLPISTLAANLGVSFEAKSGLFTNGFDTMSVFASRTNIVPNKITAVVIWRAALRSGPDTLSATNNTIPLYTDTLTLLLMPSAEDSILLTPSTYTLQDTFGMQVTLTAMLFNSQGGLVSQGTTVQFSDTKDGAPAGGYFVPANAINDSSKVSTIYFPPALASGATIGDTILIKATAMDASGNSTGRPGTTSIFISP
jgi:hypothetical protein